MTSAPWQRLSARQQGLAVEKALYEGVPEHLDQPMRVWVYKALAGGGTALVAVKLRMTIDYARAEGDGARFLAFSPRGDELLDVVDAILGGSGPWPNPNPWGGSTPYQIHRAKAQLLRDLTLMLDEGASAYRINDDQTGLIRWVDATATGAAADAELAAGALPTAGSAAPQLATAWDAAYRLHPDPPAAYKDAIRAVESAAHAIVEPNNRSATLGTMLGQLRAQPQRYAVAIPGPDGTGSIEPLIAMMELLWRGQTSRHGAQTATRAETLEEARMAVHLAVTLVQWFTTGAVRRMPSPKPRCTTTRQATTSRHDGTGLPAAS